MVVPTIINAPSSTKNAEKARDPEMHQTKKGNEWRFGLKAHVGVDAGTGTVVAVEATSANEHDIVVTHKLLREDDTASYGYAGYVGLENALKSSVANTFPIWIIASALVPENCAS